MGDVIDMLVKKRLLHRPLEGPKSIWEDNVNISVWENIVRIGNRWNRVRIVSSGGLRYQLFSTFGFFCCSITIRGMTPCIGDHSIAVRMAVNRNTVIQFFFALQPFVYGPFLWWRLSSQGKNWNTYPYPVWESNLRSQCWKGLGPRGP
jgi:hypothetical protein